MTAYYNEIDPYAAQWLRNLIEAGHIAPGDVDQRPIQDVKPDDLKHYTQCHFFAGIGVWSYALRRAGWSDDQPIWTGSCPCQPFSQAGKQKGFADERHLWPWWKNLIEICKPPIIVGEQVASALDWLDLVSVDMERAGYAFGASDLCAAGFGGAHIRQRLYFVGLANAPFSRSGREPRIMGGSQNHRVREVSGERDRRLEPGHGGDTLGLADDDDTRLEGRVRVPECRSERIAGPGGMAGGLGNAGRSMLQPRKQYRSDGSTTSGVETEAQQLERGRVGNCDSGINDRSDGDGTRPHAPMLGRNLADWLYCRDGKWRPVEPGTFPLAHAAPARVGRLRAYGNALDAETATEFLRAVKGCAP